MNELHPKTVEYILRSEPRKRVLLGQFFTPESLRRELISKIPRHYKPRALDLARGTGEFLLTAREYFIEPELYCWEIDPELAHITKEVVPKAKVEVVNSLTKPFTEEFNVVLGNPPLLRV